MKRPSPAVIGLIALAALGAPAGGLIIWLTWWSPWSWVGVALLSFSPMVAARLVTRYVLDVQMRPAMQRYSNRLVVTMVVYFLVLLASTQLYRQGLAAGPLGYVLALLPAIPILGIFALYARYFREETDEFQRQMLMTSLIWSGAATLCEATVWGFLETFGKAPHVWMWAVPVAFFAQLSITGPLAGRRYR
ncbi:MAG TPA: hypothetical protein VGC92_15410 [Phenylobacterium sp.]